MRGHTLVRHVRRPDPAADPVAEGDSRRSVRHSTGIPDLHVAAVLYRGNEGGGMGQGGEHLPVQEGFGILYSLLEGMRAAGAGRRPVFLRDLGIPDLLPDVQEPGLPECQPRDTCPVKQHPRGYLADFVDRDLRLLRGAVSNRKEKEGDGACAGGARRRNRFSGRAVPEGTALYVQPTGVPDRRSGWAVGLYAGLSAVPGRRHREAAHQTA